MLQHYGEVRIASAGPGIGRRLPVIVLLLFFLALNVHAQNLQLHYDLRHSVDPANNPKNYPSLFFEYFKLVDSGTMFVKTQADFFGKHNNIGQLYLQLFREFKFWDPLVFLHLEYNGGVGIAEGTSFGYPIHNAFLLGLQYPFQWGADWQSVSLCYRYNAFDRPSHDVQLSFYWSKQLFEDKFTFSGNFVLFTENRDKGDPSTMNLTGKKLLFWGQPQVWFNFTKMFSVGSQFTMYYHIYSYSDDILVYPTVAIKYRF